MDGTKLVTDTLDIRKDYGKQAFCTGKSVIVRLREPYRNENPGESKTKVV